MHDSGKVKSNFGCNLVLSIHGLVDFMVNQMKIDIYQFFRHFRQAIVGDEFGNDLKGCYFDNLIAIFCEYYE